MSPTHLPCLQRSIQGQHQILRRHYLELFTFMQGFRYFSDLCQNCAYSNTNELVTTKKHDWRLGKFSIYLSVARFLVYKWFQLRISSDCRSEVKVELLSNYCQSNWLAKRGLFCFQERAQYSNQFPLSTVFFGPIQFLLRRGIALIRN